MDKYTMTIGLEIHAELKTKSKMFCGCPNSEEDKKPNSNICPVCMGYPGTLPVINNEAVRKLLLVGIAVNGELADFTEFDRKNYFYPDIPKGYQISQYKYPLVTKGSINGINLTRIHLEEDTAKSTHDNPGVSLVDFNRAGVPLLELVTEPEIHTSDKAVSFAKELQLILQYLDVSDANMEKGEMRVEVNISVSKDQKFGTKVEVKNLNSFRAVGKAIDYEFKRQTSLIEKGEKILQETRGWDENKGTTFSQRSKEDAHDYRYFPDPDLPKLLLNEISEFKVSTLKSQMPLLPSEKRKKYLELGIKSEDVEFYINNRDFSRFFEDVAKIINDKDSLITASNYIVSDLSGLSKVTNVGLGSVTSDAFSKLIMMIKKGELSSRAAKDILKILFEQGGDPEAIAKERNLIQKNDPEEFKKIIKEILDNNHESVEEYRKGKDSLLQFFVGQAMKATKGSGNPETLKSIILSYLKEN